MLKQLIVIFILCSFIKPIAAQQNWAAIPCSKMSDVVAIDRMFVDSLHNDIILFSVDGHTICNTTYKGLIAYNGNGFRDMDYGTDTHDPNLTERGLNVWDCITYGNKTLFGGFFQSVGSNTLLSKSIALWNGSVWDTFPKHCFSNALNGSGGGLYGFLKYQGKLWMYGGFDTIGNTVSKNIIAFDGNTFIPVPPIPVSNNSPVTKMIAYKNKLIATGNFDNFPSSVMWRLAQYDGNSWAPLGSGVLGGIGGAWDMTIYKDTLYIAGSFSKAAGNAANNIMKWDGTQLHDAGFGGYCGFGPIYNLIPFKNRLYALGSFVCAADQRAFGVAYYENGVWTVPQDSIDNASITNAVLYNNSIYITGGFRSINGDTTIQRFAKLICPDFDAASGCVSELKEKADKLDVKIFPNPSKDKISIQFDQSANIDKIYIMNMLGQEMYQLTSLKSKQEIDISNLSVGVYIMKIESKQANGVFKIVKE